VTHTRRQTVSIPSERRSILALWADAGRPASRFEILGSVPVPGHVAVLDALCADGLLEGTDQRDYFGARRFRLTDAGYRFLALPVPSAGMKGVPKVKATLGRQKR
jgi:hypothetical protein